MDWTALHNRFMALAEVEGRSKVSSFCLDISFGGYGEIYVHLGTYDISDWPRHTNLGPFRNEAEAFAATEAKIADAERIVGGVCGMTDVMMCKCGENPGPAVPCVSVGAGPVD